MDFVELAGGKGSGALFETLHEYPQRKFTINELAKTAGVPFSTAWNIVQKWEKAGVLDTFSVGRTRVVTLRSSALTEKLAEFFSFGSPQAAGLGELKLLLSTEKEVEKAFLFGSVAEGTENLESDVDIALLAPKGFDANGLVKTFYGKTKIKLVPLVFSSKRKLEKFIENKKAARLK